MGFTTGAVGDVTHPSGWDATKLSVSRPFWSQLSPNMLLVSLFCGSKWGEILKSHWKWFILAWDPWISEVLRHVAVKLWVEDLATQVMMVRCFQVVLFTTCVWSLDYSYRHSAIWKFSKLRYNMYYVDPRNHPGPICLLATTWAQQRLWTFKCNLSDLDVLFNWWLKSLSHPNLYFSGIRHEKEITPRCRVERFRAVIQIWERSE